MSGWQLRARSICPVLDDRFLLVGQIRAVVDYFRRLVSVTRAGVKIGHGRRPKLRARRERERTDPAPLGRYELLGGGHSLCVRHQQRLPTIGVVDLWGSVDRLGIGGIGAAVA